MIINKETWIKIAKRCSNSNCNYEKAKVQWKFLSTMLFCKAPIQSSSFKLTVLK